MGRRCPLYFSSDDGDSEMATNGEHEQDRRTSHDRRKINRPGHDDRRSEIDDTMMRSRTSLRGSQRAFELHHSGSDDEDDSSIFPVPHDSESFLPEGGMQIYGSVNALKKHHQDADRRING